MASPRPFKQPVIFPAISESAEERPIGEWVFSDALTTSPSGWHYRPDSSRVGRMRWDGAQSGKGLGMVQVTFRDGTNWIYREVPQPVWDNFRRAKSPGKFINRTMNQFPYGRGPVAWPDEEGV